jgi:hypothetical protein
MILLAFAAAALAQWTGPRTLEYIGPGNFCGGGYRIALTQGERALILPQGQAPQATRLVLSHGEVNIQTGARPEPGPVVMRYTGAQVTQQSVGAGVAYTVSNETPYGLRLTSDAFQGFKQDRWFFSHANFSPEADRAIPCLSARSN